MAKKNKLTVFQTLERALRGNFTSDQGIQPHVNSYDMSGANSILYKTTNKDDYERTKLELQQNAYLKERWLKANIDLSVSAFAGLTNIKLMYRDADLMDSFPEIGAALDIVAEESCVFEDTKIKLLNGDIKTVKELYDTNINNFWVYSVDENGNCKPSLVEKVIHKGVKPLYKITLDDGTVIKCTNDHKWLKSNNSWSITEELSVGDSLMSIYDKIDYKGYEKIKSTVESKYSHTHRVVAENVLRSEKIKLSEINEPFQKIVIHHKSFNKLNNDPNELVYMFWNDHQKLHTNLNSERWNNNEFAEKMKKVFSETNSKLWKESDRKELREKLSVSQKNRMSRMSSDERKIVFGQSGEKNGMYGVHRYGKENPNYNINKLHVNDIDESEYINYIVNVTDIRDKVAEHFNLTKQSVILFNKYLCEKYGCRHIDGIKFKVPGKYHISEIKRAIREGNNSLTKVSNYLGITDVQIYNSLKYGGYKSFNELKEHASNHDVVCIEKLNESGNVYDLLNSSVNHCFAVKCNEGHIISHNCLNGEKGQIVNVYSKSDRIKAILEDLFVNRLNLQVTAPMIIRGMCKYGNQFMMFDIDNKLGIKGWRQLPVFNVERLENGIQNPYGSGQSLAVNNKEYDSDDFSTKFVWIDENNSQVPFRDWQIAHFRLLTNSMCLPYGCLVGDTRIETEFGYKEMSNIKIGDKVWTFNIKSQERELSDVTMFMPKGEKDVYGVSTFHNYIEGTEDHKLLTYSNNEFIYKEIKDIKIGDLLIIDNSYNKNNKLVKIDKSYPTEKEANLKKTMIWWDNFINYIPDYIDEDFAKFFGFMIGDGWITQNKYVYFATGEYEKFNLEFAKYVSKITNHNYRFVKPFNYEQHNYEYSSCVISSKCLALVLHRMGFIDGFDKKRIPSWVFESSDEIKKAFLNGLMISDGNYNIDKYGVLRCSIEMANEQLIKDIKTLVQSLGYKSSKVNSRNRVGKGTELKNGRSIISKNTSYYLYFYESFNIQEKKYDLINRLNDGFKTEKVRKIEYIGKKETYDFTVVNDNSNFFANGIVTHNCSYLNAARRHWRMLSLMEDMMLIYRLERSIERRVYKIYVGAIDDADVQAYVEQIANNFKRTPIIDPMTGQVDLRKNILSVDQDIFIPVRDQNAPTPIDTLSAAQNLTAMDDIKFVQNKVLTALRIPKSFLNFEENAGDGKNLALMDIRFTRVINRIQQSFLMELTKAASIHLYLLGFDDDLTNFNLTMNNPSTQAEQLEIDNIQKKISAVRDAVSDPGNGLPVMSQTRALKQIMKWSDKEIKENLEEIRLEKGIAAELEKTTQIIKRTGIFDIVDRMYGEPGAEYQEDTQQGGPEGGMGGGMPGGGGGSFGSDLDSLGAPGGDENGEIPGAEGSEPTGEMGGGQGGGEMPPPPQPPTNESINKNKKLITENTLKESNKKLDSMFKQYIDKIDENIERSTKHESIVERTDIYDKSLLINEEFSKMIDSLNILNEEADE